MNQSGEETWDVFISYASEDKEAVARALAVLLTGLGVAVWFDEIELQVGDSLRGAIDRGLSASRHGVVVLSEAFFDKPFPNHELDGLVQREIAGEATILPVWRDVDAVDVRAYSAPLADRVAAKWSDGIHVVARHIIEVVRPDLAAELNRRTLEIAESALPRVRSGQQLADIVGAAHASLTLHDEVKTEAEAELVGGALEALRDWGDIWRDIGPEGQAQARVRMTELLADLGEAGWSVFGRRERRRMRGFDEPMVWDIAVVVVTRGEPAGVIQMGDEVAILRGDTTESLGNGPGHGV